MRSNCTRAFFTGIAHNQARPGRTHCPKLHRGPASVHGFVAAHARTLPDFSPRLAFGCRSGAARLNTIARNFTAALLRWMDLSRHTPGHCPGFHRALLSVVAPARQNRISLPGTSPRPCFRLSLRRGQAGNNCPKLRRGLTSVHGFVAAHARTLPGFSPRLAFGCRSGAARVKNIARNFAATLLSVVAPARQNRISLPGTSPRPCFGA